jgi:membrane dipeptidase
MIEAARDLHRSMLTVDTHCDTPLMMTMRGWDPARRHPGATLLGGDLDLPRMAEGGLGAAFFAVYVGQGPCTPEGRAKAKARALAILDRMDAMYEACAGQCARAQSPADAPAILADGRRAIFMGMENGYPLGLELEMADEYYRRGIRYLTLCHATDNDLCASCTGFDGTYMTPRTTPDTGLTAFGERVVARLNRLGMMVDVSHVSPQTVADVLALSRVPVLASHSGARAVGDHPRNLDDAQLRSIAAQGGVVQVCFVPEFVRPRSRRDRDADQAQDQLWDRVKAHYAGAGGGALGADPAVDAGFEAEWRALCDRNPQYRVTLSDIADHIDHVAKVAGIEHVGIGSDFDGGARIADCRDASELPALTAELMRRGYSETDLRAIWGGNLMRVFAEVQAAAK